MHTETLPHASAGIDAREAARAVAAHGFHILPGVADTARVAALRVHAAGLSAAAARNGLDQSWCQDLAADLLAQPAIAALAGPHAVAVQCTVFDKSPERNWLVAWHQDLALPMAEHVDAPGWRGWSVKHGVCFAQPPADWLARVLAVRLHLDDCGEHDGGLRVMAGSHLAGIQPPEHTPQRPQTLCCVPAGGALLMRPLLWHASSKGQSGRPRRVLHVVLAPRDPPHGLRWRWAVPARHG
jgi:hypothetical protein